MKRIFGRIPFIACVVAVVLLHQADEPLLFVFAVAVAFTNLFSSQLTCVLHGCHTPGEARPLSDPARLASLANRISDIIGAILLIYALINLYG